MKALDCVHLVQFSFWEYETLSFSSGGSGILGPNGAGKTSLVDAIQIAMLGGHGQHLHFNAQSVQKDSRSLCDYALGTMRSGEGDKGVMTRKRDEALSYISLVFRGDDQADLVTAGLCVFSTATDHSHRVLGLYVLPGVALTLEDHLEDLGERGKAPLDWSVFEAKARDLAKVVGRTPTFTSKPETYIAELLHSIQDSDLHINARRYIRAFSHSINLKHVSSVGDFLRGYLVEATPIDKQGTLRHIKTLRRLVAQIEDVRSQIVRLGEIEKRFNAVATHHRVKAVAAAVRLQFQVESADTQVGTLSTAIEELGGQIEAAKKAHELRRQAYDAELAAYEALRDSLAKDPERPDPAAAQQLRKALGEAEVECRRTVEAVALQVRSTLTSLVDAFRNSRPDHAAAVEKLADTWDLKAGRGQLPTVAEVKAAMDLLKNASAVIAELSALDFKEQGAAKRRLDTALEKARAGDKGVRLLDEGTAEALSLFREKGIDCHTVSSVVTVRDVQWQGAVESVLGRNRYAIIVKSGRERDAVRLLRHAAIPEVTVVQPVHLTDVMNRRDDAHSVAALLQSQSDLALAYLRRILGNMRQVETEEELETYNRALTRDYMLSANGGTRRIRALQTSEWVLGIQLSMDDKAKLRGEVQRANDAEQKAKIQAGLSRDADERVRAALRDIQVDAFALSLAKFDAAAANAQSAKAIGQVPLSERLQALEQQVQDARNEMVDAGEEAQNAYGRIRELETERGNKQVEHRTAQESFKTLSLERDEAVRDRDYDAELAVIQYEKCQTLSGGEAEVLAYLKRDYDNASSKLPNALSTAQQEFVLFINENSIGLVDERSDWRKAATWVKAHVEKLKTSTLADYEKEATEARMAAEEAFRSDVKYKLREAIQRVSQEINDLNSILNNCPPFTGGERYKFVADVSPTHRALYDLVVRQPDDGGTGQLFDNPEVQGKLVTLMEACEAGADKGNNPLEDYRLFFNFDLEIHVNGRKEDLLSKRMGVASNGEHRVPFYVIAGAALATAYRIKQGEKHRGAGVMILDEAFYGMDAQNTFVTAEFLKSLGLQLVMAGPDSDVGKLLPVLDSYYDLTRHGPDVFVEQVIVKEPAKALLQSDIPERNPALVQRAVEQLSLTST
jgi:energy-coupling factor transporter ATP-binding protein EcfA2